MQSFYGKYPMIIQSEPCVSADDLSCILFLSRNFTQIQQEKCGSTECPLQCNDVKYDLTVSSLNYPSRELYEYLRYQIGSTNLSYDEYQQDTLMLSIYLPNTVYTTITQSAKLTPYDLLAQIGGSLGMFLSMSIFTLIEIGEIVVLTLYNILKFHSNN
jgi:hypothetical protein